MTKLAIVDDRNRKLFVYMTFGEWLRGQIEKNRFSNAELARRTGLSTTHIGNLVRDYSPNTKDGIGRPSQNAVKAIAKALGVSLDEARLAAGYAPKASTGLNIDIAEGVRVSLLNGKNYSDEDKRRFEIAFKSAYETARRMVEEDKH